MCSARGPRVALAATCAALAACSKCASREAPTAASLAPSRAWLDGEPAAPTPGETPLVGGTLVVRAMAEPSGLNELNDSFRDGWSWRIAGRTVVEPLIELDPVTYALRPLLAERWEELEGGRVTRFTLRRGVRFHDGSPFGARDVVAVLDLVGNPKLATNGARAEVADLEHWRALDEHTVELVWRRPSPLGLRALTRLPIYPAGALEGPFDSLPLGQKPVGTGPFRFEAWERGSTLSLVRHEGYWGERPFLDRVVFRIAKDSTVATQLFERGELDLMTAIQPTVWRSLELPESRNAWAVDGYVRIKSVDNSFSYIAWNEDRALFKDKRVRRALALLYPRDSVAKNVDLGLEQPTTCPYWLRGPYCDPAVKPLAYSPAEARALLAEAGWADHDGDGVLDKDGIPFRFTFLLPHTSVRLAKLAPLLQQELAGVGIAMDLEKVEGAVLSERIAHRDFDAVSQVWTEFDVEQDLSEVFHSGQESNTAGYSNPRVDALLEQIRGEAGAARRVELCREVHRLLYDDQPYLFMTARVSLDAAKKRVRGLRPSLVWYDLRRVWVSP